MRDAPLFLPCGEFPSSCCRPMFKVFLSLNRLLAACCVLLFLFIRSLKCHWCFTHNDFCSANIMRNDCKFYIYATAWEEWYPDRVLNHSSRLTYGCVVALTVYVQHLSISVLRVEGIAKFY